MDGKQGTLFNFETNDAIRPDFQDSIRKSYYEAIKDDGKNGEKSPDKIKPIHEYYSNKILDAIQDLGATGYGYGVSDEEKVVNGKKRDLFITLEGEKGGVIVEYKIPFSSTAKNDGNAHNEMVGDSLFAKEGGYPYIRVVAIPNSSPRFKGKKIEGFDSNKKYLDGLIEKMERPNEWKPDLIYVCYYEISNLDPTRWIGKSKEEYYRYIVDCGIIITPPLFKNCSNKVIVNDEELFLGQCKEMVMPKNLRNTQRRIRLIKEIESLSNTEIENLLKQKQYA